MKRFLALSRTTHGILDLAMPGFTAVLWLGGFPSWQKILLSIFTAFAAYTAIYALNDLVGIGVDREKFATGQIKEGYSVEASEMRYPLAQDVLDVRSGLFWFVIWFAAALVGAFFLNPTIVYILLAAAILEVIYVLLLKVTYWRTLVSGLVKSSGPIAAIFVVEVDTNPDLLSLLLLFVWLLFWEIGGQNVPADWNDTEEDLRVGAKTIPIRFGPQKAGLVVLFALGLTVVTSFFLPTLSPLPLGWLYLIATALAGYFLLLQPAYRLYRLQEGQLAARLFDRASYYPLAQLAIISLFTLCHNYL
ncbi:MAG: UbiA prenyltransferase family protein [Anaerolineales bacterium]|jgi:4-hydroxybenzoate polyprenyltransferase